MNYCGIDYSTTSPAICLTDDFVNFKHMFLTKTKKYQESFVIDNHQFIGMPDFSHLENEARYHEISEWVMKEITSSTHVQIEGYSYGSKGKVFHIGENTGLLKHKLFMAGNNYQTITPVALKSFANAGKKQKGESSKKPMERAFVRDTGIDIRSHLGMGDKVENPISDIIDAYYLVMSLRA